MANTYSSNLRLIIQQDGTNQGTWGGYTNTNITSLIEQAITGVGAITVSGSSDYTLTVTNGASDEARNAILNITGTLTAAINVICPTAAKTYIVKNGTTGGFAITLKTSAGTGISVPNGSTALLYCNGTSVVEGVNYSSGFTAANLTYTGTLSGGTGVVNIGSGQIYKDASGNLGLGVQSPVSDSLSITQYKNLSWAWSGGANYANIFNQTSSASLILASGYKLSSTTNGFASSFGGAWSKSAIEVGGGGAIRFFVDPETTVSVGTDITPTERMRIDSSGNVGIGTTLPNAKLDVNGTFGISSGATPLGFLFNDSLAVNLQAGSNATNGLKIGTSSTQPVVVYTDGTERMRINSSGSLLVGTTSQLSPGGAPGFGNIVNTANNGAWALALQNNATSAGLGRGLGIRNVTDFNTNTSEFIYCVGNSTPRFVVQSNGGIYNYSANNSNLSDKRVKKDIEPVGSWLDKINSIEVVNFKYKDQTFDETNIGVVAQQVLSVAPELVNEEGFGDLPEDGNPLLSVFETDLMYAMLKSIQEQQTLIETLTKRIETLEGK